MGSLSLKTKLFSFSKIFNIFAVKKHRFQLNAKMFSFTKRLNFLQKEWHGSRATKGVAGRGKYFYETIAEDEGLCRVGFSTPEVIFPFFYFFKNTITLDEQHIG